MKRKVMVISLGGSLIVPDKVNIKLIKEFRRVLEKHRRNYKFVVVCGGGSIARTYINALRDVGKSEYLQSMSGIAVTRMNARFLTYFFGRDANDGIPHDMKDVQDLLKKNDIVFCGALRYAPDQTSDATSAKLASFFKTDFINLTLVSGLYTSNPLIHKNAKFIPKISWKDFHKKIMKLDFKPGQHFVLDQSAAKVILDNKIRTYILGSDMGSLDNLLSGRNFRGTVIAD